MLGSKALLMFVNVNSQKFVSIVAVVYNYYFPFTVQINYENNDLSTDCAELFHKKHLHTIISGLFLIFLAVAKSLQVKIFCNAPCNGSVNN